MFQASTDSRLFSRLVALGVLSLGLFVLSVTIFRLHLGVDLTDEAFYAAVPYRVALGDTPYVDEMAIHQSAQLLLYPIVKWSLWANDGTDGLILNIRWAYFLFMCVVGILVFFTLKPHIGWQASWFLAICCPALMPVEIPSLSYNSLGVGFLTISICAWLNYLRFSGRAWLILCGFSQALMSLSYPPLSLVSLGTLSFAFLVLRRHRREIVRYWGLSLLVSGLTFLLLTDINAFFRSMGFTASLFENHDSGLTFGKWAGVFWELICWSPNRWLLMVWLLAFWFSPLSPRKGLVWALCAVPFFCRASTGLGGSLHFVLSFAFLAPVVVVFLWKERSSRQLFVWAWIPSMIAAFLTAFSSSNGAVMGGLGAFPAFLVSAALCYQLFCLLYRLPNRTGSPSWVALIVLVTCLWAFVDCQRVVYRDGSWSELKKKVTWGPYRGLYTQVNREAYLRQLRDDLISLDHISGRILFYQFLPAGYLLTSRRPAAASVFVCDPASSKRGICFQHYSRYNNDESIVVKVKNILDLDFLVHQYGSDEKLDQYVVHNQRKVVERHEYDIYTGPLPIMLSWRE